MNEQTAVVIGATGLTGNFVVEELLNDNDFKTVRVLGRRKVKSIHPKLEQEIVNFNDFDDYSKKFGTGDVIFCCIGTTRKKVNGDKNLYKEIDFDIPVNAAKIGLSNGFQKFLIVSAIGANANSSNFYLSLKGKTENALKELSSFSLNIFQPSLIIGTRKERRVIEIVFQFLMDTFSFLFVGPLKKYRSIGANNIAKAMVQASKVSEKGIHYYRFEEMMDLARDYLEVTNH